MSKRVFISYAREDLEEAKKLHQDLEATGHKPWMDENDLLAGQNWRQMIPKIIRESDKVILLLSGRSVTKRGFVQVEFKRALDEQKAVPDSEIFIIPVRLDACDLPDSLENLNWVDLFDDYEGGLNKIIRALEFEPDKQPESAEPAPPDSQPGIYVGYSVHDNASKWVTEFASHLKSQLVQRLGGADDFTFSIDLQAVDESPNLPPNVVNSIENSSFLIAVTSPGYAKSERCRRELNTFLRATENRPDAQVFVVERETPDPEKMPENLKGYRPFRFWEDDKEGYPRILDQSAQEYFDQINHLSHDLKEVIKCIEPIPADMPEDECRPEISDDRPPVFLAEVTEHLLDQRNAVKAYLEQAGLRVVPENNLPMADTDSLKEAVAGELNHCRVFVQLLDINTGKNSALPMGICKPQFECAKKAGKTILQWRDAKLDLKSVTDKDHLDLLQGEDVIADTIETFKDKVGQRAKYKPSETMIPQETSGLMVFLNADKKDASQVKKVVRLMNRNAVACSLPVWDGKQSEIIKEMAEDIQESDGLIVIYGEVTAKWVKKQLKLIYRKEYPLKALAVYEGPPPEKADITFFPPGMHIINCRDCLDEEKFRPFFEDLRNGGQS